MNYFLALLSSLGFAILVACTALAFSMLLIFLRCLRLDTFLRSKRSGNMNEVLETLANVFESVPLLILLIILGQGKGYNDLSAHILKALILGLFMYPSIWRYINNRIDLAAEDVYPRQMGLWKIPSLRVGFYYVLRKHNLTGIISSFFWVLGSALTLDFSIGFLSEFGFGASYINWYDKALGSMIGNMIGSTGRIRFQVILMLITALGAVIALYLISGYLNPAPKAQFNRIREVSGTSSEAIYEFKELRLRPAGTELSLDPVNPLTLNKGEFIWLNGPSGSGKSLFIKSLMELLKLGDEDNQLMPVIPLIHYKNGKISDSTVIMPQEPDLYVFPYLSVEDYLKCIVSIDITQLRGRISREYEGENKENLLNMLSTVETTKNTQVRNLSAGEKRMLAFVVALVQSLEPRYNIVILDEPDSSLDVNGIQALKFYLAKINQKSVIYVTHNVIHSREIYQELKNIGIWDICQNADSNRYIIQDIEDIRSKYKEIHTRIFDSLDKIKQASLSQGRASGSQRILKIQFPIHIRIGRGLDLKAKYNGQNINQLEVYENSGLIGIVGDNGIGKSSLLRAIVGLNYCSNPSITLGDMSPEARQSIHKAVFHHNICYVYDDIEKALPHNIPVSQIINELCTIYHKGISDTKFISRLDREKLNMPLVKFSGGERQKIIFDLVCHVIQSKLLLLDEPFSRLDWGENLLEVCSWLRSKALECPILIISHNHDILNALIPNNVYELCKE